MPAPASRPDSDDDRPGSVAGGNHESAEEPGTDTVSAPARDKHDDHETAAARDTGGGGGGPPAPPAPSGQPRFGRGGVRASLSGLPSWQRESLVTIGAFVVAFVVGAILIVIGDPKVHETATYFFAYPPDALSAGGHAITSTYAALVDGAVGSWRSIQGSLILATPLICAGLSVTLAFRTGLFNIGAQGQLIAGAIIGGYIGFTWHLPVVLHLIVALVGAIVGGAVFGGIVGFLKARAGAHEVIVTIMLNYVALTTLGWLLTLKPFQQPGQNQPISPVVDASAAFPRLPGGLHLGFVFALLAAVFVWWLLNRSTVGFELRAVGANADAARTAGMKVARAYTIAMVIAGALAGLAGGQQVLGSQFPVSNGIAGSVGFDAITVALLGLARPGGVVMAALLFGAFEAGGQNLVGTTTTPTDLPQVLEAIIVLFIAAPELVRIIFRLRAARGGGGQLAKGWNG